MICYLCGSNIKPHYSLNSDKYQELIGITEEGRKWYYCSNCGLWEQSNDMSQEQLNQIYLKYRDKGMRNYTVEEEFKRVKNIPDSENNERINQLLADKVLPNKAVLDIGSGFGIFPYGIHPYVKKIYCIEPELNSAIFINKLGIECHAGFYQPGLFPKVDLVTIIHVLEHIRNPIGFLTQIIKEDLKPDGILYIEIPDACEFDELDIEHDEFNSCHLFMFDVATLDRIVGKAGIEPFLIRRKKYPERNLSRITLLARSR